MIAKSGDAERHSNMTIRIRVTQCGVSTSWGMFVSVGAAKLYAQERGIETFEVLRGERVVFTQ